MVDLLASNGVAHWESALQKYDECLESLNTSAQKRVEMDMKAYDTLYREELPKDVQARTPPHMNLDELELVMQWKMLMGEYRPFLLPKIKTNSEAEVKAASTTAFATLSAGGSSPESTIRQAIKEISELKGVGPATATAILASIDTSGGTPFMSDAAVQSLGEKPKYTVPQYMKLYTRLRQKAAELGGEWSAQKCERALWAESVSSSLSAEAEGASSSVEPGGAKSESGKSPTGKRKQASSNKSKDEPASSKKSKKAK